MTLFVVRFRFHRSTTSRRRMELESSRSSRRILGNSQRESCLIYRGRLEHVNLRILLFLIGVCSMLLTYTSKDFFVFLIKKYAFFLFSSWRCGLSNSRRFLIGLCKPVGVLENAQVAG
jgi:hypothetical protein